MSKKKKIEDIEENEELEIEDIDEIEEKIEEEPQELSCSDINECEISEQSDILIVDEDTDFDILFKSSANKHKLDGKHALKRDTIFKGKLEEVDEEGLEEGSTSFIDTNENRQYKIQTGSLFEQESRYNQDYLNQKNLSQDIFELLKEKTDLDFSVNRRKPNRQTFNNYYRMLLDELENKYSQSEIFVELSYYFTDNIFNMFKLLDKRYATNIIRELKNKGYLHDIGNINFQ